MKAAEKAKTGGIFQNVGIFVGIEFIVMNISLYFSLIYNLGLVDSSDQIRRPLQWAAFFMLKRC